METSEPTVMDAKTEGLKSFLLNNSTEQTVASTQQPGHISGQPWTPELVITLTICIFSLAALILIMATFTMIYRKLPGIYTLKLYTIVIIIAFASFLCITGYDSSQLSSVFGLFGAIAGYLLGKEEKNNKKTNSTQSSPPSQ